MTILVNRYQMVMARYLYDPFGNIIAQSGPAACVNSRRYASKEYHAQSGLIHFGRRFFSPSLHRWINRDPIEEMGGNNLYEYAANSPLMVTDPWGLADDIGGGAGARQHFGTRDAISVAEEIDGFVTIWVTGRPEPLPSGPLPDGGHWERTKTGISVYDKDGKRIYTIKEGNFKVFEKNGVVTVTCTPPRGPTVYPAGFIGPILPSDFRWEDFRNGPILVDASRIAIPRDPNVFVLKEAPVPWAWFFMIMFKTPVAVGGETGVAEGAAGDGLSASVRNSFKGGKASPWIAETDTVLYRGENLGQKMGHFFGAGKPGQFHGC